MHLFSNIRSVRHFSTPYRIYQTRSGTVPPAASMPRDWVAARREVPAPKPSLLQGVLADDRAAGETSGRLGTP